MQVLIADQVKRLREVIAILQDPKKNLTATIDALTFIMAVSQAIQSL